jgi:hypothetical protein
VATGSTFAPVVILWLAEGSSQVLSLELRTPLRGLLAAVQAMHPAPAGAGNILS